MMPGKVSGVPLIKKSRVPADAIPESAELGETPEQIAYNYDVRVEDVRSLLTYAREHQTVVVPGH